MDRQAVRPWPKRDASIEIGGWARSTLRIRCPALDRLAERLIISVIAVTSRGKWRTGRVVANAALLLPGLVSGALHLTQRPPTVCIPTAHLAAFRRAAVRTQTPCAYPRRMFRGLA